MLAIVALMLLGQQPDKPADGAKLIRYEVRLLEMQGICWRREMDNKLKALATDDGTIAWLTDPLSILELELKARSDDEKAAEPSPDTPRERQRPAAPTIAAQPGTKAELRSHQIIRYVAGANPIRSEDGDRIIGYHPILASLNDGCAITMMGVPAADGLKVRVKYDESRILGFSNLETRSGQGLSATYQVPEMLRWRIEGEWTVTEGQTLLLSLGSHTIDDDGKAAIRERLVAITPKQVTPDELPAPQPKSVTSAP